MTELEVREMLEALDNLALNQKRARLMPADRAIQTAKQIGSSWPSDRVNLIYMYPGPTPREQDEMFRMVIQ